MPCVAGCQPYCALNGRMATAMLTRSMLLHARPGQATGSGARQHVHRARLSKSSKDAPHSTPPDLTRG